MNFLIFFLSIFLILTHSFYLSQNDLNLCKSTYRGILKYHQKKDKNEFFNVSAVLKNNTLELYRGSKFFESIDLREVITPLIIFSTNSECLTINIISKDSIVLCCNTEECINNWWFFLTKQILCLNQGEMRHEDDNKTIEDDQYKNINNFDGISINIQEDLDDIPNVSIKTES
ncbi:conserved Plasmodium protein, unknown function [Plasmodium gallinaceum]|uniref:PH domain-containing protein n=1 Tax=Plasmodium gallinaceum TaxID=5849 RepID=A0A1J1GVF9_PLAGA|nr:conserved Plasmodium protein, unknown function [Plasmodium gallinaceum]CRG96511.1 conserved Plasmodium protein, unknown function [Plasmodium gallinaceum]